MKSNQLKYSVIAGLSCLAASIPPAFAGGTTDLSKSLPDKSVVEKQTNPLCFLDGVICFDVQERVRAEIRENNFDFNDRVNDLTDDSWLLQRFRLGVAVKPVDWLKLYVQGQDSREFDSDRPNIPGVLGAEGDDNFDLRQAYLQLGPKWLNVTAGRQILSYGDERLVGAFDWNNIGRTFDAVKLHFEQSKFWVDAFTSTVVNIYRDSYNQSDLFGGSETRREQVFSGVYAGTSTIDFQTTEIYALVLDQENPLPTFKPVIASPAPFAGVSGARTDFVTLGTRIKGDPKKLGGFEYEAELAFQTGQVRGLDLNAGAVHAGAGYNFYDCPSKPRLWAEYNFASGDADGTDGDLETFQNLFPTNHKFYGYMDLFSWQNMHDPEVSFRVSPCQKLTAQLDAHFFWLANNNDAWYRANGVTAVRPVDAKATQADNYAGSELDLTLTYTPCKNLSIQGGYSHFFAGNYLSDTGADDDADFGYVMATLSF